MADQKKSNGIKIPKIEFPSLVKLITGSTLAEINRSKEKNVAARQEGKTARAPEKTKQQAQRQESILELHDSVQDRVSAVGSGILGVFGVDVDSKGEQELKEAALKNKGASSSSEPAPAVEEEEDPLQEWAPWGIGAVVVLFLAFLLSGNKAGDKK